MDNTPSLTEPALVSASLSRSVAEPAVRAELEALFAAQSRLESDPAKAMRVFLRLLRQQSHTDAARALAADLATADAAWAPPLAAEFFARLGDFTTALQIGEALPGNSPQGARIRVEALIALGRIGDAAALLNEASEAGARAKWVERARQQLEDAGHPASAAPQAVFAADEAARLVAGVQALISQNRTAEAAGAMRDVLEKLPQYPPALRLAATMAEQRNDIEAALEYWAALRVSTPRSASGYIGALRCLRRLGRLDLAPPILDAGTQHLPANLEFMVLAAQTAAAAKMLEQADTYWQRAVALAPNNPQHALEAAIVLTGPRKGRRKRMRTVLARLEAHHERFPDFAPAYATHVDALRAAGRPDDAETLSALWCKRFPDDLGLALARAGLHEEQGRFDMALQEIAAVHARLPRSPALEEAYIRALSCAGQTPAAEQKCAAARAANPQDRRFWLEYARIASRTGDWDECVRRLREAQVALPGDERLARELQNARLQLAEPEPEAKLEVDGNLFARFESLGGSGMGCEFGMVQRKLGSDTVGLLRWARTNPPELIEALNQEFDGVGSEENTELVTVRLHVDREEYGTRDRRYVMESHTFVRTSDAPADRMYQQTCRRLRFLKGKMIEDLRAAEKIFVYRAQDAIDDETIIAMHEAVARYGEGALLCVMRANGPNRGGSVRNLRHGIYAGYVDYFASDESGKAGSDVENWNIVCAKTDAHWRQAESA